MLECLKLEPVLFQQLLIYFLNQPLSQLVLEPMDPDQVTSTCRWRLRIDHAHMPADALTGTVMEEHMLRLFPSPPGRQSYRFKSDGLVIGEPVPIVFRWRPTLTQLRLP